MGNKINTKANRTDLLALAEATKVASDATKVTLDAKGKTFARKADGKEEMELVWNILPTKNLPAVACESVATMEDSLHKAAKAAKYTLKTRKDGFSVWNGEDRLWRLVGGRIKVTKAALAAQGATLVGITGIEVSLANFVKFAKTKLVPVS